MYSRDLVKFTKEEIMWWTSMCLGESIQLRIEMRSILCERYLLLGSAKTAQSLCGIVDAEYLRDDNIQKKKDLTNVMCTHQRKSFVSTARGAAKRVTRGEVEKQIHKQYR